METEKTDRQGGFTLLEMMVAIAIFSVIMGSVYMIMFSSNRNMNKSETIALLEQQSLDIIYRMREDLLGMSDDAAAGWTNTSTSFSGPKVIDYDFDTSTPTYGDTISWSVAYDDGESDNGADDDGDGLIDEMKLIRTEGSQTDVISRRLQENGFTFTHDSGKATISLVFVGWVRTMNEIVTKTVSDSDISLDN